MAPACQLHLTNSNFSGTADYLKAELSLLSDHNEEEHCLAFLHVEADGILGELETIVDQISESQSAQPVGKQLPTGALIARLNRLQSKLTMSAQPAQKNTDFERLLIQWICTLVDEHEHIAARSTELFGRFQIENAQLMTGFNSGWPKNVASFGTRLAKTISALKQNDVQASCRRDGKGIIWTFQKTRTDKALG